MIENIPDALRALLAPGARLVVRDYPEFGHRSVVIEKVRDFDEDIEEGLYTALVQNYFIIPCAKSHGRTEYEITVGGALALHEMEAV